MRSLLVALFLVTLVAARAGDLHALKFPPQRYEVGWMTTVTLQENLRV
jgi:hypothetical protein